MAKGLDCGTSFYISATEDTIKKQRIKNRKCFFIKAIFKN